MELLKDYNCEIFYHPKKANKVADAFSQKLSLTVANMMMKEWSLLEEISNSEVRLEVIDVTNILAALRIVLEIIQ